MEKVENAHCDRDSHNLATLITYTTYETDRVDEELVPGAGWEEEGGEDEEHGDEAGEDDPGPVGGGGPLDGEGEGDVGVKLLYARVGAVTCSHLTLGQPPLLVVGVVVEGLHLVLVVVEPEFDLPAVSRPAAKLQLAGVTLVRPQPCEDKYSREQKTENCLTSGQPYRKL